MLIEEPYDDLDDGADWKRDLAAKVIRLELALHNSASVSASDIDGWIEISHDVALFDKESMERYWGIHPIDPLEEIEEFTNLLLGIDKRTGLEKMRDTISDTLLFGVFDSHVAIPLGDRLPNTLDPPLRPDLKGNRLTFRLNKLKHGSSKFFTLVYLLIHSPITDKSIELRYGLTAEELPTAILGSLLIERKTK